MYFCVRMTNARTDHLSGSASGEMMIIASPLTEMIQQGERQIIFFCLVHFPH